jgi:predicted small metal-binding protein
MKRLTCREVGVECDIVFEGETDDEVMQKAAKHAAEEHNLPEIPPILDKKCREAIVDVQE